MDSTLTQRGASSSNHNHSHSDDDYDKHKKAKPSASSSSLSSTSSTSISGASTSTTSSSTSSNSNNEHTSPATSSSQSNAIASGSSAWSFSGLVGSLYSTITDITGMAAGEDPDPQQECTQFVLGFEEQYGMDHPRMFEGAFQEATDVAKRECKLLLVYLHSPLHADSDGFCRDTLATEIIQEQVDENFIFWAADISKPEGYKVSISLNVASYPYLGVLANLGSGTKFVAKNEGTLSYDDMLQFLATILETHGPSLVAAQADRDEREMDRRLREEQDMAYQESLELDRLKKRQAEEEKQRLEQEKLDQERRIREAEEAAQQRTLDLKRKRESLPQEPEEAEDVVSIRMRLPNGEMLNRRFLQSERVQMLYDWVESYKDGEPLGEMQNEDFNLVSNFPRTVYSDKSQTLEEAELIHTATLLVSSM